MERIESVKKSWPGLLLLIVIVAVIGALWWRDGERRTCGGVSGDRLTGDVTATFRIEGVPSNVRRQPALEPGNIIRSIPSPYTFDADLSSRVESDGQVWLQNTDGEWVAIHSADCSAIHAERVSPAERNEYVPPTLAPTAVPGADEPNACSVLVSGFENVYNNCARADQAKTDWNFSFGHCLYRERVTKQRIDLKDIEADCRGGSARRSIASADGKAADEHKDEGIDPADCKVSFSQGTVDFDYFEGKFLGKPALVMKSGNCRWFYWGDSPSSSPLSHVDRTESVDGCAVRFQRIETKASLDDVRHDVHRHRRHADCALESVVRGSREIWLVKMD